MSLLQYCRLTESPRFLDCIDAAYCQQTDHTQRGLSVGHDRQHCRTTELLNMPFAAWTRGLEEP